MGEYKKEWDTELRSDHKDILAKEEYSIYVQHVLEKQLPAKTLRDSFIPKLTELFRQFKYTGQMRYGKQRMAGKITKVIIQNIVSYFENDPEVRMGYKTALEKAEPLINSERVIAGQKYRELKAKFDKESGRMKELSQEITMHEADITANEGSIKAERAKLNSANPKQKESINRTIRYFKNLIKESQAALEPLNQEFNKLLLTTGPIEIELKLAKSEYDAFEDIYTEILKLIGSKKILKSTKKGRLNRATF